MSASGLAVGVHSIYGNLHLENVLTDVLTKDLRYRIKAKYLMK